MSARVRFMESTVQYVSCSAPHVVYSLKSTKLVICASIESTYILNQRLKKEMETGGGAFFITCTERRLQISFVAPLRQLLSSSGSLVLSKHVSTIPLRPRVSGYASLSETNGEIMTCERWLIIILASSLWLFLHLCPLLYPSFPLLSV